MYSPVKLLDLTEQKKTLRQNLFFVADFDFDEIDKPGIERSRRRRGNDNIVER